MGAGSRSAGCPVRFLSFSQPWLWGILDPVARKHIENRTWPPPIAMIGRRIALHAAKSWDDDAISMFLRLGLTEFPPRRALYPVSSIVGVATIDRVVTEARTLPPDQARWFLGPVGWVLTDVIVLATTIPCKGAQGLRELPPEVTARVLQALERIPGGAA